MNNKQQTVVEWLEQEMLKPNLSMKEILEQAKEMENKRMIEFGVMLTEDSEDAIEAIYYQTYGGGKQ
jgi:hypothetical protein